MRPAVRAGDILWVGATATGLHDGGAIALWCPCGASVPRGHLLPRHFRASVRDVCGSQAVGGPFSPFFQHADSQYLGCVGSMQLPPPFGGLHQSSCSREVRTLEVPLRLRRAFWAGPPTGDTDGAS